jgi:hypothetical protein
MATNIFPFLLMPIFLQFGCKGTTSMIKAGGSYPDDSMA